MRSGWTGTSLHVSEGIWIGGRESEIEGGEGIFGAEVGAGLEESGGSST